METWLLAYILAAYVAMPIVLGFLGTDDPELIMPMVFFAPIVVPIAVLCAVLISLWFFGDWLRCD